MSKLSKGWWVSQATVCEGPPARASASGGGPVAMLTHSLSESE